MRLQQVQPPCEALTYIKDYINDAEGAGSVSVVSVVNLKNVGFLAEPYYQFLEFIIQKANGRDLDYWLNSVLPDLYSLLAQDRKQAHQVHCFCRR